MPNKTNALRDNALWKQATSIAEYMYDKILPIFDDFHQTEEWNTGRKIRNSANDMMFYAAMAVGSSTSAASEFEWNNARKNLFALQTMYIFGGKQKFFELEPSIVVKMDKLLAGIDSELQAGKKELDKRTKEELKPWLEKYRLWKEMEG